jgi:carboxyl-terminal processing protease
MRGYKSMPSTPVETTIPSHHPRRLWWPLIILISFLLGYVVARFDAGTGVTLGQINLQAWRANTTSEAKKRNLDPNLFWNVWDEIQAEYVDHDKINNEALYYGAIKGMVQAVGDPYTDYFDPKANAQFNQDLDGNFEGIGAELSSKDGQLLVVAPLPSSPAEKAGLRAGDAIVAIDGTSTHDIDLNQAVDKIRGPKGSVVALTVIHSDSKDAQPVTVKITRDTISYPTVTWKKLDNNVDYLQIVSFNKDVDKKFVKALQEIIKHNPKGLIIDLRNNPGGFLDAAVTMSSSWIDKDQVVVKETFTDQGKNVDYKAEQTVKAPEIPTVILINEGSASASEIMAGALQDYGKAIIVGTKSFGKGSVQNLLPFSDGSALKVTVAKWLTPKGRTIQGEGIQPDVVVENPTASATSTDVQLKKAQEIIADKLK